MSLTSDGAIKVINAGVKFDAVDATGKTSDGLIKIGTAIINKGGTPRFRNCGTLTSDGIIKVHQALNGKVVFETI